VAGSIVQFKVGSSSLASPSPAFDAPSTAGNTVVLGFVADDYNGTVNTGWTESAEMEQQTFHGAYLWWRISTGQTSFSYTIGSAVPSLWVLIEIAGLTGSPYIASEGQFQQASANSYTTPNITPSTGPRFLLAMFGSSLSTGAAAVPSGWTNSFTAVAGTFNAANPGHTIALASRSVTGDGSTAFSTGVNWGAQSPQSQSGLIIAFAESGGGGSAPTNSVAPALSGNYQPGDTVSTNNGTWANSPTGYTYQWQKNGVNISGETSSSYTVVTGDRGASIRCAVTASNASGSNTAFSNIVIPDSFLCTVDPVISGTAETGEELTCSSGTWTPTPLSYGYRWRRNGTNISGALSNTYTLTEDDEGQSITCMVEAVASSSPSTFKVSNTVIPSGPDPSGDDIFIRVDGEWIPSEKKIRVSGEWI